MGLTRRSEGFWILPTLSRPKNLARVIESYRDVQEDAPVVVFLWKDDPAFGENLAQSWPPEWVVLVENERFTACAAMRKAVRYAPKAAFYGFLADDVVFETPWSKALAYAADPCFVSYPSDGIQNELLCTHFVCGGELVRELGYWALPGLEHSGVDLVWMVLGRNVPGLLKFRPDARWEHLHPLAEKAERDEIYEYADSLRERDNEVYQEWIRGDGLKRDVAKVRNLLYGKQTAA